MCEYCSNTRFKLKKCKLEIEQHINVYKNNNCMKKLFYQEFEVLINYCPKCGRKVSDNDATKM